MAGQERARVQRELHAGGVRDGLAQQRHHSGRGGRRRASKGTDVTRAVEHLEHKDQNLLSPDVGGGAPPNQEEEAQQQKQHPAFKESNPQLLRWMTTGLTTPPPPRSLCEKTFETAKRLKSNVSLFMSV